jgi:uncharacterized membrane protein YdbT with pleckstrin-like domain
MLEPLRALLLRILRVPPEPEPPPGDPATLRTFRASPRYFRYRVTRWLLQQAGTLIGLIFGYVVFRGILERIGLDHTFAALAEIVFVAGFIIQLPVSFAIMRLDFELRWYILSDRSLRIREGIVSVREQTMTFANIQNLEIRQNPLEQIFGISNVAVRAAGGGSGSKGPHGQSGSGSGTHEARFQGVDNAEEIRAVIRERVRLHRDAGLGDPDEPVAGAIAGADSSTRERDVLDAARSVLAEVRALRAARG